MVKVIEVKLIVRNYGDAKLLSSDLATFFHEYPTLIGVVSLIQRPISELDRADIRANGIELLQFES